MYCLWNRLYLCLPKLVRIYDSGLVELLVACFILKQKWFAKTQIFNCFIINTLYRATVCNSVPIKYKSSILQMWINGEG